MQFSDVEQRLERHRLVPVMAIHDEGHAEPLAETLLAGGLPIAEITFRTSAAEACLRRMSKYDDLLVGAGTVTTVNQVGQAVQAGARFLVSPGFAPQIVQAAQAEGVPIYPGVCTPSEVMQASLLGLETLKFFPAGSSGGPKSLRALAPVFPNIRFIPTGGVSAENLKEYLSLPNVLACGGSWMVKTNLFQDGNFEPVLTAIREAVQLANQATNSNFEKSK
ncbi:MAG: bifunctional 4-hydroxy-2-oxoglutarate aldolase/2-dehydro-3-deoxy-phosphogluconate aldolase [Planctomycetota bacterium]|nr:MAG: bifunctional 4-hydroxy-2-oxoglutarate aldolase/2-dehydro-3-deoxy-phosphogluconate aldolase [Planctomycetota bacterium]